MDSDTGMPDLVPTALGVSYVTPYHYAQLCGLTRQAIYNRINRGSQPVVWLEDRTGEPTPYIDVEAYPPCRRPWGGGRPRKA